MKLIFHQFDLRLRHTFTIAHDSRDVQPTLIVELRDGDVSGFGEATSNAYYGVTIQSMIQVLEKYRTQIESYDLQNPADFWTFLN